MPTIGSMTRTIRFNPSDLGVIEDIMKKEDVSFNNAVHLIIERAGTPQNGSKSATGTPQNEEKSTNGVHPKEENVCTPKRDNYDLIAEMATLMRVDIDKVLRDIRELLESGELYYSNGTLRYSRYEEFENLCEAKHVSVEKVLLKVMREI